MMDEVERKIYHSPVISSQIFYCSPLSPQSSGVALFNPCSCQRPQIQTEGDSGTSFPHPCLFALLIPGMIYTSPAFQLILFPPSICSIALLFTANSTCLWASKWLLYLHIAPPPPTKSPSLARKAEGGPLRLNMSFSPQSNYALTSYLSIQVYHLSSISMYMVSLKKMNAFKKVLLRN